MIFLKKNIYTYYNLNSIYEDVYIHKPNITHFINTILMNRSKVYYKKFDHKNSISNGLLAAVNNYDAILNHFKLNDITYDSNETDDMELDRLCGFGSRPHKLRLNIGCNNLIVCPKLGWTNVDAIETEAVHIVNQANNLKDISDASAEKLYSSHTLEHLSQYMNATQGMQD